MKCKRCEMDCPGYRHADIRVCIELLKAKVRELVAERDALIRVANCGIEDGLGGTEQVREARIVRVSKGKPTVIVEEGVE